MADLAKPAPLTAEDLPYLSPEEGRCELVAGELVREPPPGELTRLLEESLRAYLTAPAPVPGVDLDDMSRLWELE